MRFTTTCLFSASVGVTSLLSLTIQTVESFLINKPITVTTHNIIDNKCATTSRKSVHSTVVSPYASQKVFTFFESMLQQSKDELDKFETITAATGGRKDDLEALCKLFHAEPNNLLRLESSTEDGVRGVFLNKATASGDIIISIPLSSCLRDDEPPSWLPQQDDNGDSGFYGGSNSEWATRLAASLIDLQLRQLQGEDIGTGYETYLSLLPNPEYLRASLPVHWPEDTLPKARCTSLELAVDSAYFNRASAVQDLMDGLEQYRQTKMAPEFKTDTNENDDDNDSNTQTDLLPDQIKMREICHNALDVIQTRSCRAVPIENGLPVRVLAPIFDFINHGTCRCQDDGCANAQFGTENVNGTTSLVVRATKNIEANDEVLIDYGASARPAWRCLLSYGFIPQYKRIPDGLDPTAESEEFDDDNVAEIYMDGVRYEVGPDSVPVDMVIAASDSLRAKILEKDQQQQQKENIGGSPLAPTQDVQLTPQVAARIAKRITLAAYQLLLEPNFKDETFDEDENDNYDDDSLELEPAAILSNQLAAALRWSQHRVLMACAMGLREMIGSTKTNDDDDNLDLD